jgi:hypothetical protein
VREIKRVLRPNGLIVFTVFSVKDPSSRALSLSEPELGGVTYNFDRDMLESEFRDFKILKLECIQVYHKGHPLSTPPSSGREGHDGGKPHFHFWYILVAELPKRRI